MRALAIIILITIVVAFSQPLVVKLWVFKAGGQINDIAIGQKEVAIASQCILILNATNGKPLVQNCTSGSTAVSYSQGSFVFVTSDGLALIYNGIQLEKALNITSTYANSVKALNRTAFVACYNSCGEFTTAGDLVWSVNNLTVLTDPVVFNKLIVVANSLNDTLLELDSNGTLVGEIQLNSTPWALASCGKYLAVKTTTSFYLYNTTGSLVWEVRGLEPYGGVAFSPDCRLVAVAEGTTVHMFDIVEKRELFQISYPLGISDVAWSNDTLVLGFFDGTVYAYRVSSVGELNLTSPISSEAGAPGVPAPLLLALLPPAVGRTLTRRRIKDGGRSRASGIETP